MKIYLAGPMRGIPEFNFPAFKKAAIRLRAEGHIVFNPAERDEEHYGTGIGADNQSGSEQEAKQKYNFNIREALAADMKFICEEADAIALLPGWEKSTGARAEHATATAIHLKFIYLE